MKFAKEIERDLVPGTIYPARLLGASAALPAPAQLLSCSLLLSVRHPVGLGLGLGTEFRGTSAFAMRVVALDGGHGTPRVM